MNRKLERIQNVNLREIWTNEAADFTPWLAQEENIALLGAALDLNLEVQQQEAEVGPYRADILCKEVESDRSVVVENQLEETDHDHLGKMLTYAAGLDTPIIVWVSQEFTEEHRAVLDWLNENANGNLHFFGVEVEVLKIGDSAPAARFNVVSKPNDWANKVKQVVREGELTDAERIRLKYWTALSQYLRESGSTIYCKDPAPNSWIYFRSPMRGYVAGFDVGVRDGYVDVYFGSRSDDKIAILKKLRRDKAEAIEKELGQKLQWNDKSDGGRYWISAWRECDPKNTDDWEAQHRWLRETAEKMLNVFTKYLGT